ncbi:MAG: hypothetical protein PHE55_05670 [Methylococcaceae bacterium]|nr:hypothetical protein [Methylococcaceae bacterium]
MYKIVARIDNAPLASCAGKDLTLEEPVRQGGISGWLKSKFHQARGAVAAMGVISQPLKSKLLLTREKEQFVIDFLTDILVLYLIKLHWHLITHEWLKRPWQHRNEWMATLYMIFLQVRSKKPK